MIIIIPLCAFIFLFSFSNKGREKKVAKFKCETDCIIFTLNANEFMSQDYDGGKIIVPNYTVEFSYEVESIFYTNKNIIKNNNANRKLINALKNQPNGDYKIKFDCNNPKRSFCY